MIKGFFFINSQIGMLLTHLMNVTIITYNIRRCLMALITCPECSKEISDKVVSCPHCGFPLNKDAIETQKVKIASVN